jgi:hypothetical protein
VGTPAVLTPFSIRETATSLTVISLELRLEIDKATGSLRFSDSAAQRYAEGVGWYGFWSGERFQGGQRVKRQAR